ncbi:helix-turn-helix domain-containing protein [Termitidicoccus mucosus]|uniref:helix-turn-helix transcriptional regulator n=1 Tax=Termitidicoccus mucosus TaxID=1184151 RepID=UPI000A00355E
MNPTKNPGGKATTKTPIPEAPSLTRKDVARLFQISPLTVWRWARDGKLPKYRLGPGVVRYRLSDVTRLAEAASQESNSKPGVKPGRGRATTRSIGYTLPEGITENIQRLRQGQSL